MKASCAAITSTSIRSSIEARQLTLESHPFLSFVFQARGRIVAQRAVDRDEQWVQTLGAEVRRNDRETAQKRLDVLVPQIAEIRGASGIGIRPKCEEEHARGSDYARDSVPHSHCSVYQGLPAPSCIFCAGRQRAQQ